ncbi:uncharacterized protein LOC107642650 [Arachis ipaensis]|uniref:uncharacterized protein LOC107642650 n=1 Tax=Arachis ipaensis TaxID=130454 RepID=UPI0007AF7465|nr:uncharacterized protein LOC107642650 [Arachis ipaensis]
MGFFKKVAGLLGFSRDEPHDHDPRHDADAEPDAQPRAAPFRVQETGLPRRGFSVPAQVVVDRPQPGPVITPCTSGNGGVQGLKWYAKRLRIDEDGDVADEFIEEISLESSAAAVDHYQMEPRFKLKYNTKPVKVRKQIMSDERKLQHCVEHQGRLLLV